MIEVEFFYIKLYWTRQTAIAVCRIQYILPFADGNWRRQKRQCNFKVISRKMSQFYIFLFEKPKFDNKFRIFKKKHWKIWLYLWKTVHKIQIYERGPKLWSALVPFIPLSVQISSLSLCHFWKIYVDSFYVYVSTFKTSIYVGL